MRAICHLPAILILAVTAGCQAAPDASTPSSAPRATQQLIIKFKHGGVACERDSIARFSHDAAVPLQWLRPMSGNACVVLQAGADAAQLARGLETLRKNSSVEWAEPDTLMKTQ